MTTCEGFDVEGGDRVWAGVKSVHKGFDGNSFAVTGQA